MPALPLWELLAPSSRLNASLRVIGLFMLLLETGDGGGIQLGLKLAAKGVLLALLLSVLCLVNGYPTLVLRLAREWVEELVDGLGLTVPGTPGHTRLDLRREDVDLSELEDGVCMWCQHCCWLGPPPSEMCSSMLCKFSSPPFPKALLPVGYG